MDGAYPMSLSHSPYVPRTIARRPATLGRAGWWLAALVVSVSMWGLCWSAWAGAEHVIRTFTP